MFLGLFFLVFLWDVPQLVYLCGPITIIPGTVSILLGVRQWRHERVVVEFANWARSQRRVKMELMAQRIGRWRFETEKLVGEAIAGGLGKGGIVRTEDKYFAAAVGGDRRK